MAEPTDEATPGELAEWLREMATARKVLLIGPRTAARLLKIVALLTKGSE